MFSYFSLVALRIKHHCIYYREKKIGSESQVNLIKCVQVINSLVRSQLLVHLSPKIPLMSIISRRPYTYLIPLKLIFKYELYIN